MEGQAIGFGLAMITVSVLWAGAAAQSSCTSALISMSPCVNYITGNTTNPSSGCCTALANVVQSQPECLCQALDGSSSAALGININQAQALALPGACNVQTPSTSHCTAASPTGSSSGIPTTPTGSSSGTPTPPATVSSGTGSKSVPSPDSSSSSDASSTKKTVSLLFILLFIASYVSTSRIC